MATVSTPTSISGLFKKVYADLKDILPEGYAMQEFADFDSAQKQGESINYAVHLTHENGITLAGSTGDEVTLEGAESGIVRQASIKGCETFLASSLTTATISRSSGDGEKAFKSATKDRVKANIKSHQRFIEQMCLYGQDAFGIGRVAYFTGAWRNASFTDGTGSLGGVALTNGVNVAAKKILLNPADFATGMWIGAEGLPVRQRAIGGAVVGTGKVVRVDLRNAIVEVDFTPVASSASASHCLELVNQNAASGKDFIGAKSILSTTGTVFGISNVDFGIWKGSTVDMGGVKMTFPRLMDVLTEAHGKGLDSDVLVLVNFESWTDLMTEQAALRKFDESYVPTEAVNGMKGITFHSVNGLVTVKPSRFMRRSDALVLAKGDWKRVGSSDIQMGVPGAEGDLLIKPISTNAYRYMSYSDQALLCLCPAKSVYVSGIVPESAV